jgi:hypothetical protein
VAYTIAVEPDDDVLGWLVFIDQRPLLEFNRNLEKSLILEPGPHRLVVDVRGSGGTVKISIDGGARLKDPADSWPFSVAVPKTKTGKIVKTEFVV